MRETISKHSWITPLLVGILAGVLLLTTSCDGLFGSNGSSDDKPATWSSGQELELHALAPTLGIMGIVIPIVDEEDHALFEWVENGDNGAWEWAPEGPEAKPDTIAIEGDRKAFTITFGNGDNDGDSEGYPVFAVFDPDAKSPWEDAWHQTELLGEINVTIEENSPTRVVTVTGIVESEEFSVKGVAVNEIEFNEAKVTFENDDPQDFAGSVTISAADDTEITAQFSSVFEVVFTVMGMGGLIGDFDDAGLLSILPHMLEPFDGMDVVSDPPVEPSEDHQSFESVTITLSNFQPDEKSPRINGTFSTVFFGGEFTPNPKNDDPYFDGDAIEFAIDVTAAFSGDAPFSRAKFDDAKFTLPDLVEAGEEEVRGRFGINGVMFQLDYLADVGKLMEALLDD